MAGSIGDDVGSSNTRVTRSGRAVKRPMPVYEPSDTSMEDDFDENSEVGDEGEDIEDSEEEEEEEDDTDLSGFICADGEGEEEEEGEDEDDDDYESDDETDSEDDPLLVTRGNLTRRMGAFADVDDLSEVDTLAAMVAYGYQFTFVDPKYQIKFIGFFKRRERPPPELIREAFDIAD